MTKKKIKVEILHEKKISELFDAENDLHLYNTTMIDRKLKEWQIAKIKHCGCYGECDTCSERMKDFELKEKDLI